MNSSLPAGIETYLKEAGFSATEMLLLRNLLEEAYTLRELSAKTGKSTGVLDQAMKKLLGKGIVEKKVVNEHPRYFIRSLSAITDWVNRDVKERKEMLERRHKSFEQFIASLQMDRKNPDMEYFHGWEGIEQAYDKLLESGKELLTMTPVLWRAEDDPLRDFRVEYFRRRQWRKIFQRVIAPDSALAARFQSRDPFEYRRTLLVPEQELPISFEKTIVGDTIACIDFRDQTACFIRFPELAKVESASFEITWARAIAQSRSELGDDSPSAQEAVPAKTKIFSRFRMFILSKQSLIAFGVFAVLAGSLTFGLYKYNRTLNLERLKEKVLSVASTGALQFDMKDVNAIWAVEDIHKPEYAKLIATLNLIRRNNTDISYAYIMRKTDDPTQMAFVADADSLYPNEKKDLNGDGKIDAADAQSRPGDSYDATGSVPPVDFALKNATSFEPYTDQWGTSISGWAPIHDASGKATAIIGIDMLVGNLDQLSAQTFSPVLVFAGLFLLFVVIRFGAVNRSLFGEMLKTLKPKWRVLTFGAIFSILALYSMVQLYNWNTQRLLIQKTGERLMAIAVTAANDFDAADLEQLHWARDMKTEAYQRVFEKLNEIRNKNSKVKFAYIMRPSKESSMGIFVADADTNWNLPENLKLDIEDFTPLDEGDENAPPGIYYDNFTLSWIRPSYSGAYYDQWGLLISGGAPIFNEKGKAIAILGLDMDFSNLGR